MKQKLTLGAGLLALVLAGSGPAMAQLVPIYPGPAALPPQEISAIVRSAGFEPIRLFRNGPVYVVRAVGPSGQRVRVVVNAHMGRIVRVVPIGMRYAEPMPRYARPPRAVVPYGYYGPNARMDGPADEFDDDPVAYGPRGGPDGLFAPGRAGAPNPSAHARLSTVPSQPPLPRPRPKLAAADTTPPPPAPKDNGAPAVKPPAPPVAAAKPPASPTDGANAKPSAAPVEQHE